MVTFERRVGRLVEIRVRPPDSGGSPPFGKVIALANEVGPDALVVVISDLRLSKVVTPERAALIGQAIRISQSRVERAATLLAATGVARIQNRHIGDEAHREDLHRAVDNVAAATAWLAPVLDAAERARLQAFLAEAG
jgi:hypothetical protein